MRTKIFSGQSRKVSDFEAKILLNFENLLVFLFGFSEKFSKGILIAETSVF